MTKNFIQLTNYDSKGNYKFHSININYIIEILEFKNYSMDMREPTGILPGMIPPKINIGFKFLLKSKRLFGRHIVITFYAQDEQSHIDMKEKLRELNLFNF